MDKEKVTEYFKEVINQKKAASILGVDKFTIANYRRKLPTLGTQLEFLLEHNLIKIHKHES